MAKKLDQGAIKYFNRKTIRTTAMAKSPEQSRYNSLDKVTRRILASRTAPQSAKNAALRAIETMRRKASAMTRNASEVE